MRIRSLMMVGVTLALPLAEPLPARTIFPPEGSSGGSAWDDHCPQDKFLVGFRGRYSRGKPILGAPGTINSIRIVCASLSAAGKRGVLWYGPERGGSGGDYQEFSCPSGAGVMAYDPGTKNTPRGWVIDYVDARCVSRINGARTRFRFGHDGSPAEPSNSPPFNQQCPAGESGSGINGRSNGSGVLAIGLDCAIRQPI